MISMEGIGDMFSSSLTVLEALGPGVSSHLAVASEVVAPTEKFSEWRCGSYHG